MYGLIRSRVLDITIKYPMQMLISYITDSTLIQIQSNAATLPIFSVTVCGMQTRKYPSC